VPLRCQKMSRANLDKLLVARLLLRLNHGRY
jgi:hypothetical protein